MTDPPRPDSYEPPRLFLLTRAPTLLHIVADVLERGAAELASLRSVEECRAYLVGEAERYRAMAGR